MDMTSVIQSALLVVGVGLFFVPRQQPRGRRAALSLILFCAVGLVPMAMAGRAPTPIELLAIGAIVLISLALVIGAARSPRR